MKSGQQAMIKTIFFGLAAGAAFIPATRFLSGFFSETLCFKSILLCYMAAYGFLLAKWTKTNLFPVFLPLVLLSILATCNISNTTFMISSLSILCWIRSCVCYKGNLLQRIMAESIVCLGPGLLVACLSPYSEPARALAVWMFFLVQSLYFVFLEESSGEKFTGDHFEQARRKAEEILS